jgi:RNA polymerase sigma factor (sigma-70 family)
LTSGRRKGWELTQEAFDDLLAWLNPDREQAAKKYEDIRERLIRIFMHRGCTTAEDLADKTLNQVARKVREIRAYYVGDPALYFYGVARNIYSEYRRSRPEELPIVPEVLSASVEELDESERDHKCLENCLAHMPPADRKLLLEYHLDKGQAKIEHHKEMAQRRGITVNALRILMCRLRAGFKKCMRECLEREAA